MTILVLGMQASMACQSLCVGWGMAQWNCRKLLLIIHGAKGSTHSSVKGSCPEGEGQCRVWAKPCVVKRHSSSGLSFQTYE